MLDIALRAKLPFVAVTTDDLLNVNAVLQSIAGKPVAPLPVKSMPATDTRVYLTADMAEVTEENYKKLVKADASCVVLNADKKNTLLFDGGVLPTPEPLIVNYLRDECSIDKSAIPELLQALKGLSLKAASEIVSITMARTGSWAPAAVRATRLLIGGPIPGLFPLDTDYDFYQMQPELEEWINLNTPYFIGEKKGPAVLMPRGLMLEGPPGTGKSTAAMVLARIWKVPLFRFDVASTLNRFLGESENRTGRILQELEREAPCVVLLDEVEKLFAQGGDEGTIERMMSQILWWLQYHKSRVVTVMTSNNLKVIPPELYRPGRCDRVIKIEPLTTQQAKQFSLRVYGSVFGMHPPLPRQNKVWTQIEERNKASFAHSEVRQLVYDLIKKEEWFDEEAP